MTLLRWKEKKIAKKVTNSQKQKNVSSYIKNYPTTSSELFFFDSFTPEAATRGVLWK